MPKGQQTPGLQRGLAMAEHGIRLAPPLGVTWRRNADTSRVGTWLTPQREYFCRSPRSFLLLQYHDIVLPVQVQLQAGPVTARLA